MTKLQYVVLDQKLEENFVFSHPQGGNQYLAVVFQTDVNIRVNRTIATYPPNTVILYRPHQPIHYEAAGAPLIIDWLTFSCDEEFITGDNFIPFGIPFSYNSFYNIHSYYALLAYENIAGYKNQSYAVNQLLHLLLFRLHDMAYSNDRNPYHAALSTLRDEIYQSPELTWTLQSMTAKLNVSTRLLQKLYKERFGISCMNDVIQSRICRAKQLLISTDFTIAKIADKCGYNNVEHFCRQFYKHTNCTAGEFRKKARLP
ncbi:MAG: helix-turn-helix transcriptional regulator [Lachnospiraceae bacterium]